MAPRSGVRVSAAFRGVVSDRLEVLQSTCQETDDIVAQVSWCARCAGHVAKHVGAAGVAALCLGKFMAGGAVAAVSPAACWPPQSGSARPSVACCTTLLGRRHRHRVTCRQ